MLAVMAELIERLGSEDYEELVGFLAEAFSKTEASWFADQLPALYQPTDESMGWNLAVREGGELCAVVGVFPIELQVGDRVLKVGGIGGVSCRADCRGRGYMSSLLREAVHSMKGFDASFLSGLRHRYSRYGWEVAGNRLDVVVGPERLKVWRTEEAGSPMSIELLGPDASPEVFGQLEAIHRKQPFHTRRRTAPFRQYLASWRGETWVAREASGRVGGYAVVLQEEMRCTELVAEGGERQMAEIAAGLVGRLEKEVTFELPMLGTPQMRWMAALAESTAPGIQGNWQILEWVPVVDATMRVGHRTSPMAEGWVTVEVVGITTFTMEVRGGEARCFGSTEKPDVRMSHHEACQVLFGVLRPSLLVELPGRARMLDAWGPLPLFLSRQDHI